MVAPLQLAPGIGRHRNKIPCLFLKLWEEYHVDKYSINMNIYLYNELVEETMALRHLGPVSRYWSVRVLRAGAAVTGGR